MTARAPRFLLIEPQFVLRRTIVMVARDLGVVDFQEASNVGRARIVLAEEAFDGLVLDIAEGPAAIELLVDLRGGKFATRRDAPVIVLAADNEAAGASQLRDLGVAGLLSKPVRISELLGAIASASERTTVSKEPLV